MPADVSEDPVLHMESSQSNHLHRPHDSRAEMANPSKGKEKQRGEQKTGPLQLLDLPLDVLKDIVKEVTHTNDLASLALTHSALNNLAVPQIYSRFDIVWPDAHTSSEPRSGVDALTFGLATLVMREDLFNYIPSRHGQPNGNSCIEYYCNHCGLANHVNSNTAGSVKQGRRPRRGNLFSQYTRKFSLGNGPPDWVQEYLITKEAGKMLGTLVALTVARMPNLETFVWDMPTGVLREVWDALANSPSGQDSRLEKVWVRFHDNKEVVNSTTSPLVSNTTAPLSQTAGAPATPDPYSITANEATSMSRLEFSYRNTECPNLSILPPLKSLSVLEIDEPAYLAEMSVLIQRSVNRLRELRIGLSSSYCAKIPTNVQENFEDPNMHYLQDGGLLGLVMSKIYDCRTPRSRPDFSESTSNPATAADGAVDHGSSQPLLVPLSTFPREEDLPQVVPAAIELPDSPDDGDYADRASSPLIPNTDLESQGRLKLVESQFTPPPCFDPHALSSELIAGSRKRPGSNECHALDGNITKPAAHGTALKDSREQRLKLEVLELEKVAMSVSVLQHSLEWSFLTSLTLLQCSGHEELWKTLKRRYSPKSSVSFSMSSPQPSSSRMRLRRQTSSKYEAVPLPEYRLSLRRIHTDSVSPALITFLKETLAPNSLEWLILQDRGKYVSSVTIDSIYRGPLRYHRSSLKKVSIDASDKAPNSRTRSSKWKKWMLNRDILTFITSGKMSSLRELGMTLDYKDWHMFLQRLPNIPHLRSLYVPHIANHSYAHHLDAKELASQVVDLVIALRPEIELCYMGILTKCFEILENRNHDDSRFSSHDSRTNAAHAGPGGVGDSDEESDGTDDDHEDDGDSDNGPQAPLGASNDMGEIDSDAAEDSTGDMDDDTYDDEDGTTSPKFRLREILFYDDKISIFRARHGRL